MAAFFVALPGRISSGGTAAPCSNGRFVFAAILIMVLSHGAGTDLSLRSSGVLLKSPGSEEIGLVTDGYHSLVANLHLRIIMQDLQRIASLGGDSTAMHDLSKEMADTHSTILEHEHLMGEILGNVAAMDSAWKSAHAALELGTMSEGELAALLSMHHVLDLLEKADRSIDTNLDSVRQGFEAQLGYFSGTAGVKEMYAEEQKAMKKVSDKKQERSQIAAEMDKIQQKQIDHHGKHVACVKMLNFMNERDRYSKVYSAVKAGLKIAYNSAKVAQEFNSGWARLGDLVTLGMGQFQKRLKMQEVQAETAYNAFKEEFHQKYGDAGSPEAQEKKIELEAEQAKLEKQAEAFTQKLHAYQKQMASISAELDTLKREYKELRSRLKAKLQQVDAVNGEHFEKLADGVILFHAQRGKTSAFKMMCTNLKRQVEAYHTYVHKLASSDHEKKLKTMRAFARDPEGWRLIAPGLGVLQRKLTFLAPLLASSFVSRQDIPKIGDLQEPVVQLASMGMRELPQPREDAGPTLTPRGRSECGNNLDAEAACDTAGGSTIESPKYRNPEGDSGDDIPL